MNSKSEQQAEHHGDLRRKIHELEECIHELREHNQTLRETINDLRKDKARLELQVKELERKLAFPTEQIRQLTSDEKNKTYLEVKGSTIKVLDN